VKIEWTPTGGSLVTLGDDATKHVVSIDSVGAGCVEQLSQLVRGTTPLRANRGNVSGEFSFSSAKTYASYDTAAGAWLTYHASLNAVGSLVVTFSSETWTFAGACLRSVQLVRASGLHWAFRFNFGTTTCV
jgi:hypothetical protein